MAAKPLPSQDVLRQLLRYEPDTGKLYWQHRGDAPRQWNTKHANNEAFTCQDINGYYVGNILRQQYKAHRIIWQLVHGSCPDEIDHINGNPADNCLTNLRPADSKLNRRNMPLRSDNKSGVTGVFWVHQLRKWRVSFHLDGKHITIGFFPTLEEAVVARKSAERRLGFHPNHGRQPSRSPSTEFLAC